MARNAQGKCPINKAKGPLCFFHSLFQKLILACGADRRHILSIFTSKPIEPTPSTLKADLVAFVNSNMLIMNIIGKNAQGLCVSSTSASKFEFLELPIGTGSTQFEAKSPCYIRLCCADINSSVLTSAINVGYKCGHI